MRLYTKDNKSGLDYVGERTLVDFTEWLGKNSKAYKAARIDQED